MTKEEEKFELRPAISPSDKAFRNKVGEEAWERMKSKAFRTDQYKCQGCGFIPYDVEPGEVLDIHVVSENLDNPEESEVRTTCMFCHIIEHADAAMKNGYVALVNSYHTQGELINICRNGALSTHVEDGDIRYLNKKSPSEFLEELKNGKALEGRVKFVFTPKFLQKMNITS